MKGSYFENCSKELCNYIYFVLGFVDFGGLDIDI